MSNALVPNSLTMAGRSLRLSARSPEALLTALQRFCPRVETSTSQVSVALAS